MTADDSAQPCQLADLTHQRTLSTSPYFSSWSAVNRPNCDSSYAPHSVHLTETPQLQHFPDRQKSVSSSSAGCSFRPAVTQPSLPPRGKPDQRALSPCRADLAEACST